MNWNKQINENAIHDSTNPAANRTVLFAPKLTKTVLKQSH